MRPSIIVAGGKGPMWFIIDPANQMSSMLLPSDFIGERHKWTTKQCKEAVWATARQRCSTHDHKINVVKSTDLTGNIITHDIGACAK